jgi:hypothetical protein
VTFADSASAIALTSALGFLLAVLALARVLALDYAVVGCAAGGSIRVMRAWRRGSFRSACAASPRPQSHQRVTSLLFSFELSARGSRLSD